LQIISMDMKINFVASHWFLFFESKMQGFRYF